MPIYYHLKLTYGLSVKCASIFFVPERFIKLQLTKIMRCHGAFLVT
jgi:hypothetical protein